MMVRSHFTRKVIVIVQGLIKILKDELSIYGLLQELLLREKEVLISANLADLSELQKSKQAFIDRLRTLENERIQTLARFPAPSPKIISEVLPHVPENVRAELIQLRETLKIAATHVKDLNQGIEMLADSALQNIHGVMGGLREEMKPQKTYQRQGQIAPSEVSSGRLVAKEF
jgi:flagellar biosynthesis/type III secretory pathway chaperone